MRYHVHNTARKSCCVDSSFKFTIVVFVFLEVDKQKLLDHGQIYDFDSILKEN
jgi:hypothetical protein